MSRNPIARVIRSIRMQVKAARYPETMDCVDCAGMGVIYLTACDGSIVERKCGACNGTGVAR